MKKLLALVAVLVFSTTTAFSHGLGKGCVVKCHYIGWIKVCSTYCS